MTTQPPEPPIGVGPRDLHPSSRFEQHPPGSTPVGQPWPAYPVGPAGAQLLPSEAGFADLRNTPRALRPVMVLLVTNLVLSIAVTIATFAVHQSLIDYQLDHRHVTDPATRELLQHSYSYAIVTRAIGNVVVSVVYAFLVRALLRGRRWAYRRVIFLSAAGIVALLALQSTPYPAWMRVEQIVQALVLAALLYCVLQPEVRSHFSPNLPGRTTRRFRPHS